MYPEKHVMKQVIAVVILFACVLTVGTATSATSSQEVRMAQQPAGFLAEGATLRMLIQFAYGAPYFQISGGPGWANSLQRTSCTVCVSRKVFNGCNDPGESTWHSTNLKKL